MTEFSFRAEIFHYLPQGVIIDLGLADIVELKNIDVIGAKTLQSRIHGASDCCGAEVLGNFFLTASPVAMIHEIVADLGGDHNP